MTLESSKTLGGVGAILLLIGWLPFISTYSFGIIGIIGAILILIALHGLANIYSEKGIFNNAIYGVITGIVGVVITAVVAVVAILASLTSLENFLSADFSRLDTRRLVSALRNDTHDSKQY